ncbi:hypothetical protein FVE85_5648 [Porphyridium purpureum]|uniref:Uncharacterized protein n=1 Tax=Porphyridium purpureum TaxID=35688 RepID=A0A5J4Z5E2_PORPP|nr:hypothetical protein FVE85_5648 [Porphyridium purpureum]|eukprot:POR3204..scf295_1
MPGAALGALALLVLVGACIGVAEPAGPVPRRAADVLPGLLPSVGHRRTSLRGTGQSEDTRGAQWKHWRQATLERFMTARQNLAEISQDCVAAHLAQCGVDLEDPANELCFECFASEVEIDTAACLSGCCSSFRDTLLSCFEEVAESSACSADADQEQLEKVTPALQSFDEVCAISECLLHVSDECGFDVRNPEALPCVQCTETDCFDECCPALLDSAVCAADVARIRCGHMLRDTGDIEALIASAADLAGNACSIRASPDCMAALDERCGHLESPPACNVLSNRYDAKTCCRADLRAYRCLTEGASLAPECSDEVGVIRVLVDQEFQSRSRVCDLAFSLANADWDVIQANMCDTSTSESCTLDTSSGTPLDTLCACDPEDDEDCQQECCDATRSARDCVESHLRFCTGAGVHGVIARDLFGGLLARTDFEILHCVNVSSPSLPPVESGGPSGPSPHPVPDPSHTFEAEPSENASDTEEPVSETETPTPVTGIPSPNTSEEPLDSDEPASETEEPIAVTGIPGPNTSEEPLDSDEPVSQTEGPAPGSSLPGPALSEEPFSTDEPENSSPTGEPSAQPTNDTAESSEESEPATGTPTPTPTSEPTATTTPVPTVAVTATSSPTPAPVCIDAEWIEAHGLDKVHTGDGFGELLCIVGLEELPCGTPDHVLEVSAQSVARMRRGGLMLRTYGEVCSERACVRKLGRFNGVRHSDAHRMPEQEGHRVTTVSDRGTGWSAVENRVVVSALKMRWPRLTGALAYLQRTNSA